MDFYRFTSNDFPDLFLDQYIADIQKSLNLPSSQVFVAGHLILVCQKIGKKIPISPLEIPPQISHSNKRKIFEISDS